MQYEIIVLYDSARLPLDRAAPFKSAATAARNGSARFGLTPVFQVLRLDRTMLMLIDVRFVANRCF